MNDYRLMAACLADSATERTHLADLLLRGTALADVLRTGAPCAGAGPASAADAAAAGGCAVLAWARCGLMELTGWASGPPFAPAVPVLARAEAIASAITDLASQFGNRLEIDLPEVLAGRAAEAGWRRRGTVSANGTCRLLPAADSWLAVNLARPVDVRSLPAALGRHLAGEPWTELHADAAGRPAAAVAAAAQLVGIPAAVLGSSSALPVRLRRAGAPGPRATPPGPVLDLSAMWAGPLCASILGGAGWQVLKVEDSGRPDGARFGPPRFYANLHAGQPAVRLDFGSAAGRAELLRLADQVTVVVESSRPRALHALGLIAEDWLRAAPGRVWISITGYGRDDPQQRVAFGDDAAAAGGLVAFAADSTPVFCGDAIADPLTGLYAGLAALMALAAGGGLLVDVAMAGVSADLARPSAHPPVPHLVTPAGDGWTVSHGAVTEPVRGP
jgi:hypothetical protein